MDSSEDRARVAVYVDFDNIVISRYDQVHRRGAFQSDDARSHGLTGPDSDEVAGKLRAARVDLDSILDYASSFGRLVVSRAYADWSVPVNSGYRDQLIDRAVDLTQLFPVTSRMKNGADIRLAVDVIEDLFRLPEVSHVVIVAGDSDYIALAQRAKRLGRTVIGVGVAGATSRALMSACDEFTDYDDLVATSTTPEAPDQQEPRRDEHGLDERGPDEPAPREALAPARGAAPAPKAENGDDERGGRAGQRAATQLLMRAMRLVHAKKDDEPWLSYGEVKNQMLRMDPAFAERPLGYPSFTDFVTSRSSIVEASKASGTKQPRIRLRPSYR